jgi:hypothetical protein
MYIAALIDDSPDSTANGLTSNDYVVHDSVISAANRNFETAVSIFSGITENEDYDTTLLQIVPTFNLPNQHISPAMWIRQIKTFEARNYMANHKVASMVANDWHEHPEPRQPGDAARRLYAPVGRCRPMRHQRCV